MGNTRRRRAAGFGVAAALALAYVGFVVVTNADRAPAVVRTTTSVPASSSTARSTTPTTLPGKPPEKPPPRLLKDVSIFPLALPRAEWEQLLQYAQRAGASVVSTAVDWAELEPAGPAPVGEFASLDQFVSAVRARGLRLRFQLIGFPQ